VRDEAGEPASGSRAICHPAADVEHLKLWAAREGRAASRTLT
jgi:hypothetical protein